MGRREQLPLTSRGLAKFVDGIEKLEKPKSKLICKLLVFTGLRNQTVGHLSKEWVEDGMNGMQIRVPRKSECRIGKGVGSCADCDGDMWVPKSEAGARVVPVMGEWTDHYNGVKRSSGLPDLLNWYFTENDVVGGSRNAINRVVKRAALHGGLHNEQGRGFVEMHDLSEPVPDVMPHDLRGSWACQCIRSDINKFRVRDWGGWADVSMLNKYARFVGDVNGDERKKF